MNTIVLAGRDRHKCFHVGHFLKRPRDRRTLSPTASPLYRGEPPRAEIVIIVGTGGWQARRIVSLLTERGVLTSSNSRAPLRLAFPAALAFPWMPGLFPRKAELALYLEDFVFGEATEIVRMSRLF